MLANQSVSRAREAEAAKKAEAQRRKEEREALLAEEEKSLKSQAKPNAKKAEKKTKGLDLSQLDEPSSSKAPALNASGIENALDALALTSESGAGDKLDRHPERRFKAALAAYEAKRMPEIQQEKPGLRMQQRRDLIRKEFERAPENPFNQSTAKFDATKEEMAELKRQERDKTETRLAEK